MKICDIILESSKDDAVKQFNTDIASQKRLTRAQQFTQELLAFNKDKSDPISKSEKAIMVPIIMQVGPC